MSSKKGPERLAPPVETITLLNIEGILKTILDHDKLADPEGEVEPVEPILVTSQERRVIPPIKPWFSVTITNDGPNPVDVLINSEKSMDWHNMLITEVFTVNMGKGIIKDILLRCDPTQTASVRMVGTR